MTLEQIKNEITERIKEIRDSSSDFSGCASYDDLQKLFKKVIGKVALCESAKDLEAIDGLLSAIEELYNDCNSEASGEESHEVLFEFNFELDADDGQNEPKEENENGDEDSENEEENSEPVNKDKHFEEVEDLYSKYINESSSWDAHKLEKIYKNSINKIQAAYDEDSLYNARNYYIDAFNCFEKDIERKKLYKEAKKVFDSTYHATAMKKPNIARVCVGCVATLSGIGFGLINARGWPWIWQAWAVIGVGVSYLLISAIYAIAISSGSDKAVRRMNVTRATLAVIMAVASLVLGLVLKTELTLLGAYIATVPFTALGAIMYLIYRLQLLAIAYKIKKGKTKKKPEKQMQKS